MSFVQLSLETIPEKVEEISDTLLQAGCLAVTLEDAQKNPIFEPLPETTPLWHHTRVIGLFEENADQIHIKQFLKDHLTHQEFISIKIENLEDKNWVELTQTKELLCFENTFCIGPEALKEKAPAGRAFLILDPGLAFGTGTHPTTQLCLNFLAKHPPIGKTILDYGCGSGILGLAALKLKAQFVYACDHDSQALLSTEMNAQKNGFDHQNIQTFLPNTLPSSLNVDMILANILATPLIELSSNFSQWLKPGGTIVLSGILENQTDMVIQQYESWFEHFKIAFSEEWACVTAVRK